MAQSIPSSKPGIEQEHQGLIIINGASSAKLRKDIGSAQTQHIFHLSFVIYHLPYFIVDLIIHVCLSHCR